MPLNAKHHATLQALKNGLIVSCQPVTGGPMDEVAMVVGFARAAQAAGAYGLRIEGRANVAAVAAACALPVIGLIKRDLDDSPVRITPFLHDVSALAEAGAAIIAIDATDRIRPVPVADLLAEVKRHGCMAMADISTLAEAEAAMALGFDIIGTTMSGYTGGPVPEGPDFALLEACLTLGKPVFAEGRFNSPELAAAAIARGARAVCVGSAITRPEYVTAWFLKAIHGVHARRDEAVLAFDIGGTKTFAALVCNGKILDKRHVPTRRDIDRGPWLDWLAGLAVDWTGGFDRVAAAVTGPVDADGKWFSLNPATLDIPIGFDLAPRLATRFGKPAVALNDAQAAAWGEYRFGAAQGRDMAFVTISSGIGGGIVTGGRLWLGRHGSAGSLGQIARRIDAPRLEEYASGFGLAKAARDTGRQADGKAIFAAAQAGEVWAENLVGALADDVAGALASLQMLVDPEIVVLGGGVGLVPAFREMLDARLKGLPDHARPALAEARLGVDAGLLGVADFAFGHA